MRTGHWQSSQGGRRFRNHWQSGGSNSPGPGPGPEPYPPVYMDFYWFYGTQCSIWANRLTKEIRISPIRRIGQNLTALTIPETYTGDVIPILAVNTDSLPILTGEQFTFGEFVSSHSWIHDGVFEYTAQYPTFSLDNEFGIPGDPITITTPSIRMHMLYTTRTELLNHSYKDGTKYILNAQVDLFNDIYWKLPETEKLNVAHVIRTTKDILKIYSDYSGYNLAYSIFDVTYDYFYHEPRNDTGGYKDRTILLFKVRYGTDSVITPKECSLKPYTFITRNGTHQSFSYDNPARASYQGTVFNNKPYKIPDGLSGELAGFRPTYDMGISVTYPDFIYQQNSLYYDDTLDESSQMKKWTWPHGEGLSFAYSNYDGNDYILSPGSNITFRDEVSSTTKDPIRLVKESGWTT